MISNLAAYISCGSVIGLISGLFGIGGGVVGIPVMLQLFAVEGMPQALTMHMAIGTMMAVAAATTLAAMYGHYRNNMILLPLFGRIAPFLVAGSVAGTILSSYTNALYLKRAFAFFLLLMAFRVFWQMKPKQSQEFPRASIFSAACFFIGAVSAFFGLGGGLILVPFLSHLGVSLKNAIATATACIVPATVVAAASYMLMPISGAKAIAFSTGYVYWPAFLAISAMSICFAPLGAHLTHKSSTPLIKTLFSLLLLVVAYHLAG